MPEQPTSDAVEQIEQELQDQVDLTRAIMASLGEGVCVLDEHGRVTFLNAAATEILGWTRTDLLGERLTEPVFQHDAQGRPFAPDSHPLRRVVRDSVVVREAEAIFTGKNGRAITVAYTAAPIRNDNDETSAVVAFHDISGRKAIEAELAELRQRLAGSHERERTRLAQTLHDGPLQDLYAARYQLQAIKQRTRDDAQTQQQLALTLELFQQVSDALRTITTDLRPPALVPFGLEAAIRSHAATYQQLYPDLTLTLDLDKDAQALPEDVRLTLYRIYQEMVSNVARHAEATQLLVRFRLDDSGLLLEIQDNGSGFDVPERWIELVRRGHLGLAGAAERTEEINGRFLILSTPGEGTIVRVRAPLPQDDTLTEETP